MKALSASLLTLLVLFAASCQQDPQSASGPNTMLPNSASTPPAHPALACMTFLQNSQDHNYIYSHLYVADTDGTHQTSILQAYNNSNVVSWESPSWSPNGGAIAFASRHFGAAQDSLLTVVVSVNSHGVPVA